MNTRLSYFLSSSALFAVLLLSGCAATTRVAVPPFVSAAAARLSNSPYPALKAGLDRLLPDTLFPPASAGIKIVSLTSGETLYELNPDLLFNPASNQKLFTTSTALSFLGGDFLFRTPLAFDTTGTPSLFIKGSGDPLMSTADIDSIAGLLSERLPAGKSWSLFGDLSYFDDAYLGTGWMWDEEPYAYGMFLSPLSVNANAIEVKVRPGRTPGDTVQAVTDPVTGFVSLEVSAVTVTDTVLNTLEVSRKWRERLNTITVEGEMLADDSLATEYLSVWKPERYFLTLLAERLQQHGVPVLSIGLDTLSGSAETLFTYTHRLDSAITFLNKVSDNMSAENVLKTVGAEIVGAPGSAGKGISVINTFLHEDGLDTSAVVIVDGSGLSRYDLTSANTIVTLLTAMYQQRSLYPLFRNSLPSAGVDGTLSGRMQGSPAQGNLHAKTGTLSGVTALSGYVTTADNEELAFSILMQSYPSSSWRYRRVQDAIGIYLSTLRRNQL
jgi:D-alanyl-D-alanine carboxypeptidase/D-alanyl-D-alanine-endopeptidase (penicillin-binding protein 4)